MVTRTHDDFNGPTCIQNACCPRPDWRIHVHTTPALKDSDILADDLELHGKTASTVSMGGGKERQTKVRRREESKIERERSLRDLMAVYILAHVRGTVLTLLLNHSSMVLNR